MAYDPKSFLTRALKEGFQPEYSGPQTSEDAPVYHGELATIDGVQVRPMTIGGTEEAPEYGHVVSSPLTGKYEGYFRNDIYDANGNFLRTTLTEPGTSGLTDLAKFALNAATFGGFGPTVTAAARGIGALQTKNVPALLSAISGLPGVPSVPSGVSDILKYAGQAKELSKAVKGDPSAIFKTIVGAAQAGGLGKGFAGELDLTGSDAIEGFFEPGGEGYAEPDAGELPAWALDPYKDDALTFTLPSEDDYEELERILAQYPEQQIPEVEPKTSMSPVEMSQFLEANIDDPGTIETLMQDYFPELYRQTITTTGTLPKNDVVEVPDRTPGSPTDTTPGTVLPDDDRTSGTAPEGGTKTTGGTKTASKPAGKQGLDLDALAFLLGAMNQRPEKEEEYRVANIQPLGYELMYGLRG